MRAELEALGYVTRGRNSADERQLAVQLTEAGRALRAEAEKIPPAVVERCLESGCKGRPVADALRPDPDDYFVLKPKHSAFFSTTLDTLLRYLGTRALVLGGFAADICVLFTANDAYMRDLRLVVPADGVASNEAADRDAALALMRRVLKADTPPAREIDFAALTLR